METATEGWMYIMAALFHDKNLLPGAEEYVPTKYGFHEKGQRVMLKITTLQDGLEVQADPNIG
jgi:hypothetical protein